MGLGCNVTQIRDAAENVGILDNDTACFVVNRSKQPVRVGCRFNRRQRGVERVTCKVRHRLGDAHIMRVQAGREHRLFPLGHAARHRDCLPASGRAVIHRRIRHIAAEQPGDLRLEFEQHLERALRDFGLIGRVGGQELATLDDVIHRRGDMVFVRPCPKEERMVARRHVLARKVGEMAFDRHFACMVGQTRNGAGQPPFGGDVYEQIVNRFGADSRQH